MREQVYILDPVHTGPDPYGRDHTDPVPCERGLSGTIFTHLLPLPVFSYDYAHSCACKLVYCMHVLPYKLSVTEVCQRNVIRCC